MSRIIESQQDWRQLLEREYPGVRFEASSSYPPGLNAVAAGVLVGRFLSARKPAYGVIFTQSRSCSGKA